MRPVEAFDIPGKVEVSMSVQVALVSLTDKR